MDNKNSEKLSVSDGTAADPVVEYGQVLEYPNEDIKAQKGELHRTFKARHIQMICLGGCIGSGIFISTGKVCFVFIGRRAKRNAHEMMVGIEIWKLYGHVYRMDTNLYDELGCHAGYV